MTNANEWLNSNGGGSSNSESVGSIAFAEVGDMIVGAIATDPRVVETQYGDRLVMELTASNATAKADGNDVNEGDVVTVWVRAGAMARAISNAVKDAGADGLAIGGKLALKHSALGEKKPGRNPAKLFEAKYEAPTKVTNVDDLFG